MQPARTTRRLPLRSAEGAKLMSAPDREVERVVRKYVGEALSHPQDTWDEVGPIPRLPGLPSWRDKASYVSRFGALERHEMAWELLRRRQDYRRCWNRCARAWRWAEANPDAAKIIMPPGGGETILFAEARAAALEKKVALRWGMKSLHGPDLDIIEQGLIDWLPEAGPHFVPITPMRSGDPRAADVFPKGRKYIQPIIYVDEDLEFQFAEIRALVAHLRRENKKTRGVGNRYNTIEYLRVLDAIASGASYAEIGQAMSPEGDHKNAGKHLVSRAKAASRAWRKYARLR